MISWKRAKHFIETRCRQSKDKWYGKPVKVMPWQEAFLQPFFDDPSVKICSAWLPRKNGKSTIAGAVGLTTLLSEPGAEVYIICGLMSQAEHMFRQIADFIDLDPDLSEALWVRDHRQTIEYPATKSILQSPEYRSQKK